MFERMLVSHYSSSILALSIFEFENQGRTTYSFNFMLHGKEVLLPFTRVEWKAITMHTTLAAF